MRAMSLTAVRTSFDSPWQNGVAERWVESCRRDLLGHAIAVKENHLKRMLSEHLHYLRIVSSMTFLLSGTVHRQGNASSLQHYNFSAVAGSKPHLRLCRTEAHLHRCGVVLKYASQKNNLHVRQEDEMFAEIPATYRDLFEKPAFANLGTLMPDGRPQVTPVWVDFDGRYLIVNTARGRQKDKNLRRDGRVSLAISDPVNPYRYLEVRGKVAEIAEKGADEHIDKMAKKYLGKDKYPFRQPGEVRVMFKIEPEHINNVG